MSIDQAAPALAEALRMAERAHAGQFRKGTHVPYIAHPLAVASLVLDYGGSTGQAIAALLHDVIEDGGTEYAEHIEQQFGSHVRELVEACTDGTAESKAKAVTRRAKLADWRRRKLAYLDRLRSESDEVLLVSACDKLHNARSIVADLEKYGPAVFERFKPGRAGTLWYYDSVLEILRKRGSPVTAALEEAAARMRELGAPETGLEADIEGIVEKMKSRSRIALRNLIESLERDAQSVVVQNARAMGNASALQQYLLRLQLQIKERS